MSITNTWGKWRERRGKKEIKREKDEEGNRWIKKRKNGGKG